MIRQQTMILKLLRYAVILNIILIAFNGPKVSAASSKPVEHGSQASQQSPQNKPTDDVLTTGWFDSEPYYTLVKGEGGLESYSGLDAEMARAIAQQIGYKVKFTPIDWSDQIENLKNGAQHFAVSATYTEERTKFVYFSEPYRREENSFFVRKGDKGRFKFNSGDMKGFVESLKASKAKIAITEGMVYAAKEINEFIADSANKPYLVATETTFESMDLLLKGEIDGILDDRVITSAAIWRTKNTDKIEEVYLGIGTPIHFMFSKKAVSESFVNEFNKGLAKIKADGTYSRINRDYMFPVLILQTIEKPWFFFLEAFAILALVISGLIIAYKENFNLYGTMMIAFVSMSGGIMRDVLVNRPKLGIILSPIYAISILVAILVGIILVWTYQLVFYTANKVSENLATQRERIEKHKKTIDWFIELMDAFGLAAYTVTGVVIALVSQLDPLWLWGPFMAVITTTGGGIIRDILRRRTDMPLLKSDFYGEIAMIWGWVLSMIFTWEDEIMSPESMFHWIIMVVVGSLVTRIIVKWSAFKGLSLNLKGFN
jgi:polar amino acid transport system substrate-binding protein